MKRVEMNSAMLNTGATKKMEKLELLDGMEELSMEGSNAVVGGESLAFWIGYAIGRLFS